MEREKTRILVVSDSHGRNRYLKAAIQKEQPFDMLIHCGDVEGNIYSILGTETPYEIHAVRGNCDYSGYSDQLLVEASGHRILVTHGHTFRVRYDNNGLLREAVKRGADVVCFGHTHIPEVEYSRGIVLLNPGSISEPRRIGREYTYAMLTLEKGKTPRADIRVVTEEDCRL